MAIEMKPMTQEEFMYQYNDTHREHFNPKLFERSAEDIVQELEKVILSCERNRYFTLKVAKFRVITSYEEIYETLYEHEERKLRKDEVEKIRKLIDELD